MFFCLGFQIQTVAHSQTIFLFNAFPTYGLRLCRGRPVCLLGVGRVFELRFDGFLFLLLLQYFGVLVQTITHGQSRFARRSFAFSFHFFQNPGRPFAHPWFGPSHLFHGDLFLAFLFFFVPQQLQPPSFGLSVGQRLMGGVHFFALACGHLSGSFVDFWCLLQVRNLFFFPFFSDTISSFQFFLVPFGLAVGDRHHRPFRPTVGGGVHVGASSLCQGPTFIVDPGSGLHSGGFRFLGRTAQCFQFGVRQFGTGQVSFDKRGGVMVGGGRGSV